MYWPCIYSTRKEEETKQKRSNGKANRGDGIREKYSDHDDTVEVKFYSYVEKFPTIVTFQSSVFEDLLWVVGKQNRKEVV